MKAKEPTIEGHDLMSAQQPTKVIGHPIRISALRQEAGVARRKEFPESEYQHGEYFVVVSLKAVFIGKSK